MHLAGLSLPRCRRCWHQGSGGEWSGREVWGSVWEVAGINGTTGVAKRAEARHVSCTFSCYCSHSLSSLLSRWDLVSPLRAPLTSWVEARAADVATWTQRQLSMEKWKAVGEGLGCAPVRWGEGEQGGGHR